MGYFPKLSEHMHIYVILKKAFQLIFFVSLTIFTLHPHLAVADRGAIPITAKVGVSFFEPSQNAIIAWNGVEEILILTTEAYTTEGGKVLEFLPLPSKPISIEAASLTTFDRAVKLIKKKAPKLKRGMSRNSSDDLNVKLPGIEVVMEATIGPHKITVVRVEAVEDFYDWLKKFFENEGITEPVRASIGFKRIVGSYIERDINYFVFDVIDTNPPPPIDIDIDIDIEKDNLDEPVDPDSSNGDNRPNRILPLQYRFNTDRLYYPLNISSRIAGDSKITLFLITPGIPEAKSLPRGFTFENYLFPTPTEEDPTVIEDKKIPIAFPVSLVERVFLSPSIANLISGFTTRAFFSVVSYDGPLRNLSYDFELYRDNFISTDFECEKRSFIKREKFLNSTPPGYKRIVLANRGNAMKTGGTDNHTSSAAIDGDPETPYTLTIDGSWWIDLGAEMEIDAVDILATVKDADIEPSKNSLFLFISDTGKFKGEEKRINTTYIESRTTLLSADNPYQNRKRVRLTDKSFKARYLKISYPYSESTSPIYLFEVMVLVKKKK